MHVLSALPSLSEACMGGDTSGTNVSKSKRPVLDWAFSSQYRFSKSMMSVSSTSGKKIKQNCVIQKNKKKIWGGYTVYTVGLNLFPLIYHDLEENQTSLHNEELLQLQLELILKTP